MYTVYICVFYVFWTFCHVSGGIGSRQPKNDCLELAQNVESIGQPILLYLLHQDCVGELEDQKRYGVQHHTCRMGPPVDSVQLPN